MDYKQKYLKYKSKYLNQKNNQNGGQQGGWFEKLGFIKTSVAEQIGKQNWEELWTYREIIGEQLVSSYLADEKISYGKLPQNPPPHFERAIKNVTEVTDMSKLQKYPYITTLIIGNTFKGPVDEASLPKNLKHITYPWQYNYPINTSLLPKHLESITFQGKNMLQGAAPPTLRIY